MPRRFSRWIVNIFCGVCAIGAIAVGIEGARGFIEDSRQLFWHTHIGSSRKETVHILCGDGRFVFAVMRKEWRGEEAMPQMPERIRQMLHRPGPVANPVIAAGEPNVRRIPSELYGAHELPQPMWGFSSGHTVEEMGPRREDMYFLTLPAWLPAIVLATPPVIWLLRRVRKVRRRRAGCCLACGYDLRASAEVCPECGTRSGAEAPPANPQNRSRWKPVLATSAIVVIATGLVFGVRSAWRWWAQRRIPDPVEVEREARKDPNPELYAQHRCLIYAAPPEQVVYEEDPTAAAELLKKPNYFTSSRTGGALAAMYVPTCYQEYRRQPPGTYGAGVETDKAMLFLHERTSKNGIKRLVIVQCNPIWEPADSMPGYLDWSAEVVLPAKEEGIRFPAMNMLIERLTIGQPGAQKKHIRFFAGQIDLKDDAHFTIRYERDQEKGILDGWLSDDGQSVSLLVRDANSNTPKRPPADEQ